MNSADLFEQQLVALLPRLRRFAHGLCRNASEADDLVQQAAERALRSRGQWQPGTRLDSWLYRILRNLWIDSGRAHSRRSKHEAPAEEAGEIADPGASPHAALELSEAMAAMQRLPEEQREIVMLILVEGFGYRETAELLDLPIGTVSSRLVRGRTALLAFLERHGD
ncbi:MAG TPA: RNA polymerase sigma factor [Sphingomicrobium sp.]|nr:RNA polymerase sigma factor [Sphingomicrobium sp.]